MHVFNLCVVVQLAKFHVAAEHLPRITGEPPLGVQNELQGSKLFSIIVPEWYKGILEYLSTSQYPI